MVLRMWRGSERIIMVWTKRVWCDTPCLVLVSSCLSDPLNNNKQQIHCPKSKSKNCTTNLALKLIVSPFVPQKIRGKYVATKGKKHPINKRRKKRRNATSQSGTTRKQLSFEFYQQLQEGVNQKTRRYQFQWICCAFLCEGRF